MAPTPALVAADGMTPLRRILTTDIASASVTSARGILTSHPATGLDPLTLTQILASAESGQPLRFLELAEAMEEKYPHYAGVLGTRKRQVCQLPITVEAASDSEIDQRKAQLIRNWLKRDTLEAELFDIQDALGKGFAQTEIIWDLSPGRPWLPARLEWRDPRWFEFDRQDGRTVLLRGKSTPQPLPPFKFISHVSSAKSGLPIRGGLARVAAWSFLFQNFAIKDWVSFAEVYGFPIRVGKYDAGATAENIRTLLNAVSSISQDAAAVIPSSMQMEFIANNSTGSSDLYRQLAEYCDKAISKLVLGQTATTDSQGGGLGGSGKEHNDVRGDIERADAKALAATLNRDLVIPIIDFNFGRMPGGMYPQINIGREDPVDTKQRMDGIEKFVGMGGRVGATVIADLLGIPDPQPGEQLLVAPVAQRFTQSESLNPGAPINPATGLPDAPGGSFPPETAATRFLSPLTPSYGAIAAATAEAIAAGAAGDDIDAVVAALADDGWEATMAPLLDPAIAALAAAGNYDAALAALPAALATMDAGELAKRLERAAFAVRIAGRAGADATLTDG